MTDNRATLLPCPFCGGNASKMLNGDEDNYFWWIECNNCNATIDNCATSAEAITAWNTRAERVCKVEQHGSLANWPEMVCWSCSECGFGWHNSINDKQFSYCPNCGRKVVDGGAMSESYSTRWHELFGTPERAARTLITVHEECESVPCSPICPFGDAPACPSDCESSDYNALLEWLRGDE